MGAISFQTVKCIGRCHHNPPPIILCKKCLIQYFVIRLSLFFEISIFVTTNKLTNKINSWSSVCPKLQFSFNGENKSINESMIPYYGTHGKSQRINDKSIRMGYDIWVLAKPYDDSLVRTTARCKERKTSRISCKRELGGNVVLRLVECLPPTASYNIFMNRYFTSFCLLFIYFNFFWVSNIWARYVLKKVRLRKCTITGEKQLQKKERSHFFWFVTFNIQIDLKIKHP